MITVTVHCECGSSNTQPVPLKRAKAVWGELGWEGKGNDWKCPDCRCELDHDILAWVRFRDSRTDAIDDDLLDRIEASITYGFDLEYSLINGSPSLKRGLQALHNMQPEPRETVVRRCLKHLQKNNR